MKKLRASYVAKKCLQALALLVILFPAVAQNTSEIISVDKRKKSIISQIIHSISWPSSVNKINICALDDRKGNKTANFLKGILFHKAPANFAAISSIHQTESQGCHLLFVSKNDLGQIHQIFRYFKDKNILLISDIEDFALYGGHINFVTVNTKMGIVINTVTLKESGLDFDITKFNNITVIPTPTDLDEKPE